MDISSELLILLGTSASIAFFHTLLGPDHYLPFIMMSRSGKWSTSKTVWVTILCGAGHVASSIMLGFLGIAFGLTLSKLTAFESFRGNIAAWGLLAFGLTYLVWGIRKAIRNRPHRHEHAHEAGDAHSHKHTHSSEHAHVHKAAFSKSLTPWVLFVIFVLGPCEPLIPMLMYPAAKNSMTSVWLVSGVFALVTILTMLTVVMIASYKRDLMRSINLERYTHAIAGAIVSFCGISILFLGL